MRYYKVIKDNKVIDVLSDEDICYLKYSKKHECMFNAKDINDAQAIYSSDHKHIWHVNTLLSIPVDKYDTVSLQEIDVYEYNKFKMLNGKTPESIIDEFVLSLVEGGIL